LVLDQPGLAWVDRLDGIELAQKGGLMAARQFIGTGAIDDLIVATAGRFDTGDQLLGIAAQDTHSRGKDGQAGILLR